ncbi:MAG: methyl-accepting chemotaxis protein [Lachnobacterium sp.]|nr:methyl-accepting chemotaxis protein [Lachnobacterium sp.]MDY5461871.1 methyl-accepting chemotaxis protein [Agathobacter sp.]
MRKHSGEKKRGSLATKIIMVVCAAVIVSNVFSIMFVLRGAQSQIRSSVKTTMMDMAESSDMLVENAMNTLNQDQLTYDAYAFLLKDVKIKNVDSSYVYLVNEDGTMLYHPTEEKVGQPVENVVVTGLVKQLQNGEHPGNAVADYDFHGTAKYAAYCIMSNNDIVVVSADESDVLSGLHQVSATAFGVLVGIVLVMCVIAYIVGKRMAKPLVKLGNVVEQMAEGNLNASFDGVKDSNDEIGLIKVRMQHMATMLSDIVEKIREASDHMTASSWELNETSEQTLSANGEISRAVQDVAEGSTNMATSIMDINDNLGTMSSETQVIDSSVHEIKKQAAIVQESSQMMSDKMRNMRESSVRMDEGIATISERIRKVNEVVDKVREIVSVIEEISGQTNLLSLNASIEAARAGDAGRGFAVVAEEIRVLSDNTSEQLENIKQIISELISECSECVKASENIVEDNAAQKEEISYVLTEFGTLDEQIGLTADKAEEIKKLVETMVELNGNITQSSGGLTDVSSANAAATEEMTANIEELNAMMHGVADMAGQMHDQSEKLNNALKYFK